MLSDAAGLQQILKDFQQQIQQQVEDLRHEVASLREDHVDPTPPEGSLEGDTQDHAARDRSSSPPLEPMPPNTDPSLRRLEGVSWAEEMEILQPHGEDDVYGSTRAKNPTRVVKVKPATEAILKRSFESLLNEDRVDKRNVYSLPKVAVTKVPTLDKVMAAHCSKTTKTNDSTLSRIQALTLDALAPLTNILELFNLEAEEIQSDLVANAVETAVTLLGNASCHISTLRRTKVLEEYNKDLVLWAQDREAEFLKAAPQLFGPEFPKDATTHLEQVSALRKARYTQPYSSGFRRGQPSGSSGGSYQQKRRPAPYYPPMKRQQPAPKRPPAGRENDS